MGYIEIHDGIANRQISVPAVPGTLRVEVHDGDRPSVIVPEAFRLVRTTGASPPDDAEERTAPIDSTGQSRGVR